MLGDHPVALDQYPLQQLNGIQASDPIYEKRTINAKYRCEYVSEDKLSFEPIERQHRFDLSDWLDGEFLLRYFANHHALTTSRCR